MGRKGPGLLSGHARLEGRVSLDGGIVALEGGTDAKELVGTEESRLAPGRGDAVDAGG
jgi:hypothetical protein